MYFSSDNTGPVPDEILAALTEANQGYAAPYGADPLTAEVTRRIRDVFEAPEAAVYLVALGTAANALALATLSQPWQTIFCSARAHIHEDECNAPEFYTGGAKLTLVGDDDKMTPQALRLAIEAEENRGVHGPQCGPVSITQITEMGHLYALSEIEALCAIAKENGLPVHLDGARFANALVALNCSAADMTWRAGVDAVSFGGTKNGLMGVEAVVFFDPAHGWEFELRRKRAAHLFSKHRYLAAQMAGYLRDDLWLRCARRANEACARLVGGLRGTGVVKFQADPQGNMVFCSFPRAAHQRLAAEGAMYNMTFGKIEGDDPDEMLGARLVCDWSISDAQIDRFVALLVN